MAFRPCIDLKDGRVVQIVGGTLTASGEASVNHVSERGAAEFAALYRRDGLRGGHIIMLGSGNDAEAISALQAYPGGMQAGGGMTPDNAASYLEAGASHVIVTSFLFEEGQLSQARLEQMAESVGRERLVIDLSCRRTSDGAYYVATDRWQTITRDQITASLIHRVEEYCDELLIHAADVEGRQGGVDEELVTLLGKYVTKPATYAGGARALDDIARVDALSRGKLDLTIGSALDIFGGTRVRYEDAARQGRH